MPRLRRSDLTAPGIERIGAGKGFWYRDPDGEKVTDAETIERIEALVLPPAWKDVWISPHPHGHVQATGTDAAGRRQYRYHDVWREQRDHEKFTRVLEFASRLPKLRATLLEHLRLDGLPRERALACSVRLLDLGFFRLGSEDYAEENETYGVATLQQRHVKIDDEQVVFDYNAKGGKRRVQVIADSEVVDVVERLKKRRGSKNRLLAFKDGGRWKELHPSEVNEYLKEHAGECSAKDFRTWNGTVLAALGIAVKAEDGLSQRQRDKAVVATVKEVAWFLGNTPAVARASYIDPRVFERFEEGWTIAARVQELGGPEAFIDPEGRIALEDAVRDLLRDVGEESPALAHVDA
ncbi:DNA topoisomerase IB [Patulibacter sp.]|uniref:DNA topoisomerase IB n=1 Tax=Patulibacter sp. TaxID=1912859 RepID=UPI002717FD5A|nr:DNA topoisomerase IB [Patulibacter sp.]MDO9408819.1 DNA topoisomerase IB [Patulibacter sp.]